MIRISLSLLAGMTAMYLQFGLNQPSSVRSWFYGAATGIAISLALEEASSKRN